MTKIKTATADQWRQIDQLKQLWIDNTTKQYSHAEVSEVVERMWKSMGIEKPIVLLAPCPFSMVIWSTIASQLGSHGSIDSQLYSQLYSQLGSQLDSQLRSQLDSQLYSQLDSQLYSQLTSQLDSQLTSQLTSQLYSQLRSQLDSQLYSQLYSQLDQLDSQLRSQLRSQLDSQLTSQLYSQLDSQLTSQLDSQLYSQLYSQLRSQLDSQLTSQLYSQLYSQLDSQLDSQLTSQLYSQLTSQLYSQPLYVGQFWRARSGWYAGAKLLGVDFDKEKLSLFSDWNERASTWCAFDRLCVVSANPAECHWQDGVLHNQSGPAVRWTSGYGLWSIGGVAVDGQIVMRPESQTVDQIRSEENEEVKRIRIDRFTWERYLRETNSKRVDRRKNEIEGTWESLYETPDGLKTLVCACPSTAKVFALEVESSLTTCLDAQRYLSSGLCDRIISAS